MRNLVRVYVAAIVLLAVLFGALVYSMSPSVTPAYWQASLAFGALGLLGDRLSHGLARGASGSIGFVPFVTCALLAPSWITIVVVLVSVTTAQIAVKRELLKSVFNVAQHGLAIAASIAAYTWLGGESLLAPDGFALVPYCASFVTFLLVNSIAVSGAIAVSEGVNVFHVWRQNYLKTAGYDLLTAPVAYFFAWFYREHGIVGAFSLAIPMIGFRQLYKTHWQLERNHEDLLLVLVAAIEARDPYTSGHSKRVARNAKLIARMIGLSSRQIEQVGVAALLHDVGKIHEVFAPILRKPERLTPEEWALMQTHPIKSAELVQNVERLKHAVAPVRHHHENWDGSGYPDGLAGLQIPLGARIIIFADTIDAMMSDRPYRKALGEAEVRAELVRMKGRQFDPEICEKLLASPQFGLLFAAPGQSQNVPAMNSTEPRPSLLTPHFVPALTKGRRVS